LLEEDGIQVLTFYKRYRRQGPLIHTRKKVAIDTASEAMFDNQPAS